MRIADARSAVANLLDDYELDQEITANDIQQLSYEMYKAMIERMNELIKAAK